MVCGRSPNISLPDPTPPPPAATFGSGATAAFRLTLTDTALGVIAPRHDHAILAQARDLVRLLLRHPFDRGYTHIDKFASSGGDEGTSRQEEDARVAWLVYHAGEKRQRVYSN